MRSVASHAASTEAVPSVGIFWRVAGVLVIDRSTLQEAEPYGDCLTHAAGHYEKWCDWQAHGGAWLASRGYPTAIVSTEYDEWPRGRIAYETDTSRFVLYADRRLQDRKTIQALLATFGIAEATTLVRSDAHYR